MCEGPRSRTASCQISSSYPSPISITGDPQPGADGQATCEEKDFSEMNVFYEDDEERGLTVWSFRLRGSVCRG